MQCLAPGRERERLPILQMESRPGEQIEVADVVVVEVRDDHVLHRCSIYA